MYDYSSLSRLMKKQRYTKTSLANELGISRQSTSNKLNNKVDFTQEEISKICKILKISNSEIGKYFFS